MENKSYEQIGQTRSLRFFTLSVIVSQVLGLTSVMLVAVWMGKFRGGFAWMSDPGLEFNYHPLFMVIGLVFLGGESIMSYRVFRNERKMCTKLLHASLHGAAAIFVVVGLKAVFDSHNLADKPIPNLYSLHSWLGLGTVILFGLQFIFGFTSFLFPKLSLGLRETYMPVHRYFGVSIFVLSIATALMGIMEKIAFTILKTYSQRGSEATLINCFGLCLVGFGLAVVFIVTNDSYRRQPLPEEEVIQFRSSQIE